MATVSAILKYLDNNNENIGNDQNMDVSKTRKRRLDNLSWEEKLQRKKLKNRVAAQTSRDRKKAKMDQMEQALQQLFSKSESLVSECEKLRFANEHLQKENAELYERLQAPCLSCAQGQNRSVEYETLNGSTESLLQQKGRATYPAAALSKQEVMVLLEITLICLLYQTCSMNLKWMSTSTHWNNSLRASYKILPEIWKQLLKKLMKRNHKLMGIFLEKWWGKHQQNWNPLEVK